MKNWSVNIVPSECFPGGSIQRWRTDGETIGAKNVALLSQWCLNATAGN